MPAARLRRRKSALVCGARPFANTPLSLGEDLSAMKSRIPPMSLKAREGVVPSAVEIQRRLE
jgi:hypothetical protein